MDMKELKNKLRSAYWADRKLRKDVEYLDSLRSTAESVSGMQYDKIAVKGGLHASKIEQAAVALVVCEDTVRADMEQLRDALQTVDKYISCLDGLREQTIMRSRYQLFEPWERIAADTGYTWQHVHRLHKAALHEIASKM